MNSEPTISIIVAIGPNREIGNGKDLLWHISADFKRFKTLTTNHPIIMGRKTFESIGKPLPNRTNIVITHDPNFIYEGIVVVNSLEKALNEAKKVDQKEIFIIGGGQIYQQAIQYANKLYLTHVKGNFDATIFFPKYSEFNKVVWESEWMEEGMYTFQYVILKK